MTGWGGGGGWNVEGTEDGNKQQVNEAPQKGIRRIKRKGAKEEKRGQRRMKHKMTQTFTFFFLHRDTKLSSISIKREGILRNKKESPLFPRSEVAITT